MAEIQVQAIELDDAYRCEVTVTERGGETQHQVTLKRADYQRLAGGVATPEELVAESFRFLLEREPKEAILRSFDLTIIGSYFPEYDSAIRDRL